MGKRLRYPLSSGTPLRSRFRRASRSDFQKPWAETSLESFMPGMQSHVTTASDACQIFAARARIVSGTQIRLNRRKSARHFKAIFSAVISEFESSQPSHAVGSLPAKHAGAMFRLARSTNSIGGRSVRLVRSRNRIQRLAGMLCRMAASQLPTRVQFPSP
jgi:hypothetical protein